MTPIRMIDGNFGRRVETGPTQIGADWPGVFIRGDNALANAHYCRLAIETGNVEVMKKLLERFADLYEQCAVNR